MSSDGGRGRRATVLAAAVLGTLAVFAADPIIADERTSLTRLRQVSLSVEVAHPLPAMTAAELTEHLVSALSQAEPPLTIRDGLDDLIRLTISVRPISATTLRGFWLPFSGTYGIGSVRLGVERMVNLAGVPRPFPALVWHTEWTVGSPWQVTDREIMRLVDEMATELLDARRSQVP